jgi:hypothetical protein
MADAREACMEVDKEEDSDSGSDSGSSSSSDGEDVEVDTADMEQIMKLESQLSQTNVYDLHLQVGAGPPNGAGARRGARRYQYDPC